MQNDRSAQALPVSGNFATMVDRYQDLIGTGGFTERNDHVVIDNSWISGGNPVIMVDSLIDIGGSGEVYKVNHSSLLNSF